MESNMKTRTYTAHTCALTVSSKEQLDSAIDRQPIDFTLHLDDPDRDELDPVTLQGGYQQLEHLQQVVNKYVSELVAKFPLPTANDRIVTEPDRSRQIDPDDDDGTSQPDPKAGIRSGIFKNLPGLRDRSPKSPPTNKVEDRSNFAAKPSIAELLGRWNKPSDRQNSRPDEEIFSAASPLEQPFTSRSSEIVPTTPYLSGVSDDPEDRRQQSLGHQLHLGNLATTASGQVLSLSAIQLFDLSTVLDEYAAEHVTAKSQAQPATLSRANILDRASRSTDLSTTATSLSRLPNLPKIPVESEITQVYYRTRRSRSTFMSGIPWAIAAAIAVGVPLLLLDPNPNPLKDAASKVNMPDLTGAKKPGTAKLPTAKVPKPSTTSSTPNSSTPTPWQAQPVQPPQVATKPLDSGGSTTPDLSKIGIAPLPDAIATKPGQDRTTTGSLGGNVKPSGSSSTAQSGVAPNPLNASQPPSTIDKIDPSTRSTPNTVTPKVGTKPGTVTAPTQNRPVNTASTVSPSTTTTIGQLPIDPIQTGKVSVSKQPILVPPADLAPATNAPNSPQIPSNPDTGIDPATIKPQTPKFKPIPVASKPKPKTVKPTATEATPRQTFEPFTPVPKNPNLINPNAEQPSPSTTEPQASPVVPDRPLQSNNGNAEPTENPSLEETKRYFQGKWKADTTQTSSLQYVVQVSGKSGIVRSVSPQGEAATTYLQQTKFIKPGQKLISPSTTSTSDQKIRVLLQPDGNVDTFIEP